MSDKFGARIYPHIADGKILVKQTKKSDSEDAKNDPYAVQKGAQRFVRVEDDAGIADAVRAAILGELGA